MKGFSSLIFILTLNAFSANHPSCDFFEKDSLRLFKVSKSNESRSLIFNLKSENCLLDENSSISVYFKEAGGSCSIPSFTFIRNIIGYKNYSELTKNILLDRKLIIPNIKDLVKSKNSQYIGINLFQTQNGCKAETYIKYTNSTLSFDHIYQEVDYLSIKSVEIYKSNH